MKNIFYNKTNLYKNTFLIMILCFHISCSDDILDKTPITEINTNLLDTEEKVYQVLTAAYDPMQWKLEGPAESFPQLFQDVRADDLHSQQSNFWANGLPFDHFATINASNQCVSLLWSKNFTGISRANFAIKVAEEFKNFKTNGLKERIIAESKFLRGYYYLELAKHFGGVPLFLNAITSTEDELFLERSPIEDVYKQIEADLKDAAAILPKKGQTSEVWRATSGAALGMLARAQLYQKKYTEVVKTCQEVMTHGYSLETNFAKNFSLSNEFGVESIFEINYVDGLPNEGSKSWQYMFMWAGEKYTSWGNLIPRQSLVNIFDNSDQRKRATFILPGDNLNSPMLASLGWSPAPADFGFAVGSNAMSKKFFLTYEELDVLLFTDQSPLNEKVLRYSEILLMYAEASLMGGGGNGEDAFQLVVNRAYGESNPLKPTYSLENLKSERRKEFATEGMHRFTDLVRWGDIEAAMQAVGKTDFNIDRDVLLPIPATEIQLAKGILKQNPLY